MIRPELSLVFPLYNEEKNVEKVIGPIVDILAAEKIDYEIILVDNGSRDRTASLIKEQAQKNPRIKTATVEVNQGYGWGILCGMKQASGENIGFMGSDGQIAPADVFLVYKLLRDGGYKFTKVRRVERLDGTVRKLNSLFYNILFNLMFSVSSKDVNGTPKILSRDLLEKIDPVSKDWFLDAEMMIKTRMLGHKVGEVDVDFLPRAGGSSNVKISTIFEFLRNMFNYRFSGVLTQWHKKSRS